MIEDFRITIPELLEIVRKGDDMTINEKKELDRHIGILCDRSVTANGERLTDEQHKFVSAVLTSAIRHDVPKIDEMMRVFGLDIDTVFFYMTEPYEWRSY